MRQILFGLLACWVLLADRPVILAMEPTEFQFQNGLGVGNPRDPEIIAPMAIQLPSRWEYSKPLISPALRDDAPSAAQKDPTVVFHGGKWHVTMTVKLPGRSAIEYCTFEYWEDADRSQRTILNVSTSNYYCAPQVFYFAPHKKWYLIYQMDAPEATKMWVAYSTTTNIADPDSWTQAQPILDGGKNDPRQVGGLDYWIICDDHRAYLFLTDLNGKMWRLWLDRRSRQFAICIPGHVGQRQVRQELRRVPMADWNADAG